MTTPALTESVADLLAAHVPVGLIARVVNSGTNRGEYGDDAVNDALTQIADHLLKES